MKRRKKKILQKIKSLLFCVVFVLLLFASGTKLIRHLDEPYSGYGYEQEQMGKEYNILTGCWE